MKDSSQQNRWVVISAELLTLALIVLALRLGDLFRPPIFDELYHVLAARSWVADGTFQIAHGVYPKSAAFTILVGLFFEVFGESLIVARLPSVIAGTLTVLVLFLWIRSVVGRQAAWIAALALALAPLAIFTSQFIRFYSLHALFFLCGSIGIFLLGTQRHSLHKTSLLVIATVVSLGLASHLHKTTIIGLIPLALWFGFQSIQALGKGRSRSTVLFLSIAVLGGAIALGTFIALNTNFGLAALERYTWSPPWSAVNADRLEYYVVLLGSRYATFFSLFPLAIIFAVKRQPALASLCTVIFIIGFLTLSFGASKAPRYIFFVMPFFFAVWGIALAEVGGILVKILRNQTDEAMQRLFRIAPNSRALPLLRWPCITLIFAFVMVTNTAFPVGFKMALNPRPVAADWRATEPVLRPIAEKADVVLTTEDISALYFIERHDIVISTTKMLDRLRAFKKSRHPGANMEFSIDPRTGRPIISTASSLRQVMACYSSGIVIVEEEHWLSDLYISEAIAVVLATETVRVDFDEATGIRAYRWDSPLLDMDANCGALPKFTVEPAAANS